MKKVKNVRFTESLRLSMNKMPTAIGPDDRALDAYADIGCEVVVIDRIARTAWHIGWHLVRECQLADEMPEVKKMLEALDSEAKAVRDAAAKVAEEAEAKSKADAASSPVATGGHPRAHVDAPSPRSIRTGS